MYVCMCSWSRPSQAPPFPVRMYVCMYVSSMYVCIVYECMYVWLVGGALHKDHLSLYVCIEYVCMYALSPYVCMYVSSM
jgi:hypothetical protein